MLAEVSVHPQHVTHVLFAGGVCKCQPVKNEIRKVFKHAQALESDNPQPADRLLVYPG